MVLIEEPVSMRHFVLTPSIYTSLMLSFPTSLFSTIVLGHILGVSVSAICPSMWTPTRLKEVALMDSHLV